MDAEYVVTSNYFWEWVVTEIAEEIKPGFPYGGRANRMLQDARPTNSQRST